MFNTKKNFLSIFPALIIACILTSCDKNITQMFRDRAGAEHKSKGVKKWQRQIDIPVAKPEPICAVVLLHGLLGDINQLEYYQKEILDKFGDRVLVIQPPDRGGVLGASKDTNQQAADALQHIKNELAKCNKMAGSLPLIVVGYSQGGVLACILANNYQANLNIDGIVTINAPLRGVSALNSNDKDIDAFASNASEGLQLVFTDEKSTNIKKNMSAYLAPIRFARMFSNAANDIFPDSTCTKEVYRFLRNGAHNIPCLLMAGYHNDFRDLFKKDKNSLKPEHNRAMEQLTDAYTQLLTSKQGAKHDTLVPLDSQLCRGDSFDDLTMIHDTNDPIIMPMPNQSNIEGQIYKNMAHAGNLVLMGDGVNHLSDDNVLSSPRISTNLLRFIEKRIKEIHSRPNKEAIALQAATGALEDIALD